MGRKRRPPAGYPPPPAEHAAMSFKLKTMIDAYSVAKGRYDKVHNQPPDENKLPRLPTLKNKQDIASLSARVFLLESDLERRTNELLFQIASGALDQSPTGSVDSNGTSAENAIEREHTVRKLDLSQALGCR
jgi:hypothetical protein